MSFKIIFLVFVGFACALDSVSAEKEYNSTCESNWDNPGCTQWRGFYCDPKIGRCVCWDDEGTEYNEEEDRCEAYLGELCRFHSGRGDGSTYTIVCKDPNSECVDDDVTSRPSSTCACKDTHIPSNTTEVITPDTRCLPTYGTTCDKENLPCHESVHLSCTNNRCQCEHPLSQLFDKKKKMCLGMVDTENSCGPAGGPLQCGSHAECGNDGQCHCAAGRSADFSLPGKCKLHHGEKCSMKNEECNTDRGLECMGGICQCGLAPDVAFDQDKQICAVNEGYSCSLKNEVGEVMDKRTLLACMTGLTCVQKGINPNFGVCKASTK